jgi:hypothetical protein
MICPATGLFRIWPELMVAEKDFALVTTDGALAEVAGKLQPVAAQEEKEDD